jgi:antibiotic biosynthesis monooxygenase (ABM) superfamily enzyme
MNTPDEMQNGATVVITQRIREQNVKAYEDWLNEIQPICRSYVGHLDSHVIRPVAGMTDAYTFIIRFDTIHNLRRWMTSEDRRRLIEKARPLFVHDDYYAIRSGLDFWFTPTGEGVTVPVRWKQFLLTCSAIYPLVLLVPLVVSPTVGLIGFSRTGLFATLCGTVAICFLMTYVVMPHYTKLVRRWLYAG